MTDEEFDRANAEYAALPGTAAEFISWRDLSDGDSPQLAHGMAEHQRADGATYWRWTVEGSRLWCEGWTTRPRKEAPFQPIMVTEPSHEG